MGLPSLKVLACSRLEGKQATTPSCSAFVDVEGSLQAKEEERLQYLFRPMLRTVLAFPGWGQHQPKICETRCGLASAELPAKYGNLSFLLDAVDVSSRVLAFLPNMGFRRGREGRGSMQLY